MPGRVSIWTEPVVLLRGMGKVGAGLAHSAGSFRLSDRRLSIAKSAAHRQRPAGSSYSTGSICIMTSPRERYCSAGLMNSLFSHVGWRARMRLSSPARSVPAVLTSPQTSLKYPRTSVTSSGPLRLPWPGTTRRGWRRIMSAKATSQRATSMSSAPIMGGKNGMIGNIRSSSRSPAKRMRSVGR